MKMTYGERLQYALEASKKTRPQLAERLGISEQAISQVILGNTKALNAENNARAARFLAVDDLWLAAGEGDPKAASAAPPESTTWPFVRVAWQRVMRLPPDELAFIEAKLETELTRAEERLAERHGITPVNRKAFRDPSVAKDEDYLLSGSPAKPRQTKQKRAS